MLHLLLTVIIACGFYAVLRHLAFDKKSISLLFAGLALCYVHLYHSNHRDMGLDPTMHEAYIQFIDTHEQLPSRSEEGVSTSHHQPFYYLLATAIYRLAAAEDADEKFQYVRHLSVIFYVAYLTLAAMFLRLVLCDPTPHKSIAHAAAGDTNQPYLLALAMVAFWPIGIMISGRIHPDLLGYVGQMGIAYSLCLWVTRNAPSFEDTKARNHALANAFIFTGVLLLARNFGVFFLYFTLGFLAYGLYRARGNLTSILSRRLMVSILFALACYALAVWRNSFTSGTEFSMYHGTRNLITLLETFGVFNPWLFATETMQEPLVGRSTLYFWHYFFRTAILGDYHTWQAWPLVFALGFIWLAMLAYTMIGTVVMIRRSKERIDRHMIGFILLQGGMMVGMLCAARYVIFILISVGDVRYVFPLTALFSCLMAMVIRNYQRHNQTVLAQIGSGLVIGFVMLSIGIILEQDVAPFSQLFP